MFRKSLVLALAVPFLYNAPVYAQLFSPDPPAAVAPAPAASAPSRARKKAAPFVSRRQYRAPQAVAPTIAPPAQHLLSSIKFDSTLGEVLPNLHTQSKQILERARSQNDYLLMRIGADLSLAFANFEGNNKPLLEKPLKTLDISTQQFITQADSLLLSILKNQDREVDINELLNAHAEVLAKAPTIKHLPTVYSYSPYILKISDLKKPIQLTIKGLSFNYGVAKLEFAGVTLSPVNESAGVLTFEIDGKAIESKSIESSLQQATLTLVKPASEGDSLESIKLPITMMVMPLQAGNFILNYSHIETTNKSEIKSIEFNHLVKNNEPECKDFTTKGVNPTRVIKNLHEIFQGGEGGSSQVSATAINEFTVKLCAKKLNKLSPTAQVASIWQWEEHWQDHQERQEKLEGSILEGKDDITIDKLPPALHRFSLAVKGTDNRSYIFNGSGDKGLFTLRFNPSAKQIVLGTRSTEPRLQ